MLQSDASLHPAVTFRSPAETQVGSRQEPGSQIDRKGQNYRVKDEREQAMDQSQAPHTMGADLDIGDLARHADHEREIGEVEEIRFLFIGKFQSSGAGKPRTLIFVVIKPVRVVHRKDGMDK